MLLQKWERGENWLQGRSQAVVKDLLGSAMCPLFKPCTLSVILQAEGLDRRANNPHLDFESMNPS